MVVHSMNCIIVRAKDHKDRSACHACFGDHMIFCVIFLCVLRVYTTIMTDSDIRYPVTLKVGYGVHKEAKAAGASWNAVSKQWEARTPAALFKCSKWTHRRLGVLWKREWLDVPYSQRSR